MNKQSIFYTFTFVFIVAIVCVFLGIAALIRYDKEIYTQELNTRYAFIANARLMYFSGMISQDEFIDQTKNYRLITISKISKIRKVMKLGKVLARARSNLGLVDIISYHNDIYLKIIFNGQVFLYQDTDYEGNRYFFIKVFGVCITLLLILLYSFVIKKLRPLSKLKKQVDLYGQNKLIKLEELNLAGFDEISELSCAFYKALTRIQSLNDSRKFFLRNMMHELKTPITKGLITIEMLEANKYSMRLQGIFSRLEILINEFAAIEQISSGASLLNFKKYNILDLIDEAKEIAMRDDDKIKLNISTPYHVRVDFKLFTTAIKNMLDNAIKHSTDGMVTIELSPNKLVFINKSGPLLRELSYYTQPFTKDGKEKDSFGLGLYIVSTILSAHNLGFTYEFVDGLNYFAFTGLENISD